MTSLKSKQNTKNQPKNKKKTQLMVAGGRGRWAGEINEEVLKVQTPSYKLNPGNAILLTM